MVRQLAVVEQVIAKQNEFGPHRKAALRKWVRETFKVCDGTAGRYIRLAQERLRSLTQKSAEEHTLRYLAKLDELIYAEGTADRNRISAIDKACMLLGLYKQGQPNSGAAHIERINTWNLERALAQDEPSDSPATGTNQQPEVPSHEAPSSPSTLLPQDHSDGRPSEGHNSTPCAPR